MRGEMYQTIRSIRSIRPIQTTHVRSVYTGSHAIIKTLVAHHTTDVFVYSGGAVMPLIDLLVDKKTQIPRINYWINNHEQCTGHTATGYAKSTGKTGICMVTSGPGLTNMLTSILDAHHDSTPLVCFSGQVPHAVMGTRAFQECPATQITKHCTKWSYLVQPNDCLESVVREALRVAQHGKKGAVHIDLPKCILVAPNGQTVVRGPSIPTTHTQSVSPSTLLGLIRGSTRPVLYCGQGAVDCVDELREFADILGIPVTTTIHGLGVYCEHDRLSLGFLGMHGHPVANHAIQQSDMIICLGARFDDRTTGNVSLYAPLCRDVIHVNICPQEIGTVIQNTPTRTVHGVVSTCKNFLSRMLGLIGVKRHVDPMYYTSSHRAEWCDRLYKYARTHPINYPILGDGQMNTQMAICEIGRYLGTMPVPPIIPTGVGNHQMMSAQYIVWTHPRTFITSGSLGVMGAGLPYAIGAQIANPHRTVCLIDGDGSFNHTHADLQTIARYNLPIKIFIMNDGQMSMVRAWEQLFFEANYVATISPNPDYVMLAQSHRIHAIRCEHADRLEQTVREVFETDGAVLCDLRVQGGLCLPLVPPGKALDQMIMYGDAIECTGSVAPS